MTVFRIAAGLTCAALCARPRLLTQLCTPGPGPRAGTPVCALPSLHISLCIPVSAHPESILVSAPCVRAPGNVSASAPPERAHLCEPTWEPPEAPRLARRPGEHHSALGGKQNRGWSCLPSRGLSYADGF